MLGVSGVRCEDHSYGFEELSFMEFPPLDRRTNLISLEFATMQRDSLLLYNPGGSNSREFFALEILDGAVHLSYDLGSGPVRLQTYKQVADGYFHSVIARRIGSVSFKYISIRKQQRKKPTARSQGCLQRNVYSLEYFALHEQLSNTFTSEYTDLLDQQFLKHLDQPNWHQQQCYV